MKKERITAYVDRPTKEALDAEKDGRSLSNHAGHILTKHVSKQEGRPVEKKEYGK